MLRLFIALFTLVLTFNLNLQAQDENTFPQTRQGFLDKVSEMLLSTHSKTWEKKSEELLEKFAVEWLSERFDPEVKDQVIRTANLMAKNDMRSFPHFYDFLNTMTEMAQTTQPSYSVIAWLQGLEPYIEERSSRNFDDYLEWSINLFKYDIIHGDRSNTWKFAKGKYVFEYDTATRLRFDKLDLICASRRDSSVIESTQGIFYKDQVLWKGIKGRIDWRRVKLEKDEVYAEIAGNYVIDMQETSYSIDTVLFSNHRYLQNSLLGSISDNVLSSSPNNRTSYPRFESFVKSYEYEDIFPGLNYIGGIAMQGAKLYGSGEGGNFAELRFYRNDTIQAFIKSLSFLIEEDKIVANRAAVSMYFNGDSIHHPGLNMKYTDNDKQLTLYRSGKGIATSPFFNSYHKVDMHCEAIYWKIDSPEIAFEMIRGLNSRSAAYFESANFYSDEEFYKMQRVDPVHPLERVKAYSKDYNTQLVQLGVFAAYLDMAPEQVNALLLNLARKGFLAYNVEDETALVKQRLYDYLLARAGEIDYDVVRFTSVTQLESNALLNLDTYDMIINGVREISLSDSQRVYIYPADQKIIMQKNRDFVFSGTVRAGLFDFYAQDCSFEYDTFRLNLPVIDSLAFMVKTDSLNRRGEPQYASVQNVIAQLGGDILIDHPANKSGIKPYPGYPVFNSKEESFVFYDRDYISNGVYEKERFYYQLEPFSFERLDNFSTDELKFEGFLVSDNTFPLINQPLVVMPDNSLGFVSPVPDTGYPVYAGKGRFFDTIRLDNEGLHGKGRLQYLSSQSTADNFMFYPDSLRAVAKDFMVEAVENGVEFPVVKADSINQFWRTDTNEMFVNMIKTPFRMYDNNSQLIGLLRLNPNGMRGAGVFTFEKAEINSRGFEFYHHSLNADTSDFRLLTADGEGQAIITEDYATFIDFRERAGTFLTLGNKSLVEFPFNQYISSMDEMNWLMDEKKLKMVNNMAKRIPYMDELNLYDLIDFDFNGSEFISTREDQDSLAFFSQTAVYDMVDYKIQTGGVKIIKVADAGIFPGNGKVNILKDAVLETLEDAYIVADTSNKYHTFYESQVNIFSRKKYEAKGKLDYIDKHENPQAIDMTMIAVDSAGQTFAYGEIPEGSVFFLSPYFMFQGNVSMQAKHRNLYFEGGYRPNQECLFVPEDWVAFESRIDPADVVLPLNNPVESTNGTDLYSSLFFSQDDEAIYPAFLSRKKDASDELIIGASGKIMFNSNLDEFRIGSRERINLSSQTGNYMSLSTGYCTVQAEGEVNLGISEEGMQAHSFGTIQHMIIPDSTQTNLTLMLNFPFNEDLLKMMADSINQSNLEGIDISNKSYQTTLSGILGQEKANEVLNELKVYGRNRKMPDQLIKTITFTDINLVWNREKSSWFATGKIGISNILDMPANKKMDGYIQIEKRRSGNSINIYLQVSADRWYFFTYRGNVMQVLSSDQQFNTMLAELGNSERVFKLSESDLTYEYIISTRRKQIDFVREMEKYLNRNR